MPQAHEHDQVAVTNIDKNCTDTETYVVERSTPAPDASGAPNPMNIPLPGWNAQQGQFSHAEYFEVRYNGQPFRLAPGETRVLPRYIAEHFAKHLADHILRKQEMTENREGLVQSAQHRPAVLAKILRTESWFLADNADPSMAQPSMAEQPGVPSKDLGHVPNYAVGSLTAPPKTAEEILAEAGEPTGQPAPPPGPQPGPQAPTPPQAPPPTQPLPAPPTTGLATPNDLQNQKDPAQTPSPASTTDTTLPVGADTPGAPPAVPSQQDTGGPVVDNRLTPEQQNDPATTQPPTAPTAEMTKADYIREAVHLGIEVNGRESVEELQGKIKAFATPK